MNVCVNLCTIADTYWTSPNLHGNRPPTSILFISNTMSAPSDVSSSSSSLPVQLSQLLRWTSARLRQFDQDASVTSASNIPGCPLVTARQIPGQGYGIVMTRDITGDENRRDGDGIELMRATPEMQLRISGSRIKDILPKEGEPSGGAYRKRASGSCKPVVIK